MSRDFVNAVCATLPGAERSDPWGGGHDAWKVGGKMFAVVGAAGDAVSVKTPSTEDAAMLIDLGRAERAPYLHRSWVKIPWALAEEDELNDRIRTSYAVIRSGLAKKLQAILDPI